MLTNFLPWTAQVVIIDAMLLINIRSLRERTQLKIIVYPGCVLFYQAGTSGEAHIVLISLEKGNLNANVFNIADHTIQIPNITIYFSLEIQPHHLDGKAL